MSLFYLWSAIFSSQTVQSSFFQLSCTHNPVDRKRISPDICRKPSFRHNPLLGTFLRKRAAEGRKVPQKKPLSSTLSHSIVNWPNFFRSPDRPARPAPEIFSLFGRNGINLGSYCSRISQARTLSHGHERSFQRRSEGWFPATGCRRSP